MPQAYSAPVGHQDPMEYLGAAIADPTQSPQTREKIHYDPWKDYNAVMRSIAIGASDPEYCQSFSLNQVRLSPTKMDVTCLHSNQSSNET